MTGYAKTNSGKNRNENFEENNLKKKMLMKLFMKIVDDFFFGKMFHENFSMKKIDVSKISDWGSILRDFFLSVSCFTRNVNDIHP